MTFRQYITSFLRCLLLCWMVHFPGYRSGSQPVFTPMVSSERTSTPSELAAAQVYAVGGLFHSMVVHKGVGQLLLVVYSGLQAMLLILLVRTMGKPALTSCS